MMPRDGSRDDIVTFSLDGGTAEWAGAEDALVFGQPRGFLLLSNPGQEEGSLVRLDGSGNVMSQSQFPVTGPSSAIPGGGIVLFQQGAGASWTLLSLDESGTPTWSMPFPLGVPFQVGVDVLGNILVLFRDPKGAHGAVWIDADGVAGAPFEGYSYDSTVSSTMLRPSIGGGLFMLENFQYDAPPYGDSRWTFEFRPGEKRPRQAPRWLTSAHALDVEVIERGIAYAVPQSSWTPDYPIAIYGRGGSLCGTVLVPAPSDHDSLRNATVGQDGTLLIAIEHFTGENEAWAAYEWWPQLFPQ